MEPSAMSDLRKDIQSKFQPTNRFENFGDVINRIRVQGFRCHVDTVIEVQNPITALCGLNGTGKSTLLQLAAVAYSGPKRYQIRDFIVSGRLDPSPFTAG